MAQIHSRIPSDFGDAETRVFLFEESDEAGIQSSSRPAYAYEFLQAFGPATDNDGSAQMILGDISGDPVWEESAEGGIQPQT